MYGPSEASSGSFTVKNDNIHSFFSLFWLRILNLPASLEHKNTRVGPFPWKRSVLQNPDRQRTTQSTGICLRLGLPYNKVIYPLDMNNWGQFFNILGRFPNLMDYFTNRFKSRFADIFGQFLMR